MVEAEAQESISASWRDLLRDGRALYSAIVVLGVALYALQILVMIIIMPTAIADLGGAEYYTWPAMIYTVGSIIGSASVGPSWAILGQRRGCAAGGVLFLAATIWCALVPDIGTLIAARLVQGFAGGLVLGGSMALISELFPNTLRKRILAAQQGTWMICQLSGPLVGGLFAEIGWWRGSFWAMVPLAVIFILLVWMRIPSDGHARAGALAGTQFPFLRLVLLGGGVLAIAISGPAEGDALRALLVATAVVMVWTSFWLDRRATHRLFPSEVLSRKSPIGLALLIFFIGGMVQVSINIFMPLLLQVVHGVTPMFVSFVTIVISCGWTLGTFVVSGWHGRMERTALLAGPLLMIVGLAGIALTAQLPLLAVLTVAAWVMGIGIGIHNVNLVAKTMAHAREGEERVTSAAVTTSRSVGNAFGAAVAGGLSSMAGLGDAVDPEAVGAAVTVVFSANIFPLALAAVCMFALIRLESDKKARQAFPESKP